MSDLGRHQGPASAAHGSSTRAWHCLVTALEEHQACCRLRCPATAPILPVPTDHITTCEVDWAEGGAFTVHPLTVGYWMRGEHESFES